MTKKECTLEAEVLVDLDHGSTPFDIFQTVTGMNKLLEIMVMEMNIYTKQKGYNFEITEDEMKTFPRINFIISINKLPSLEDYWSTDKCIRNEKIQNVMTITSFQSILQNLHFSNNGNDDKTDKSHKIRPVIEHLNKVFAEILSNSPFQSVNKHMCKFKGRLSMKQYIKNKPIKWVFKYWYSCDSETDYAFSIRIVPRAKGETELNLGSSVVLDLCQVLKDTSCHVFFDNFFNSPTLIQNLHDNGLHGLSTAHSNRISMPQMKKDKETKRGDYQCKFYNHIACIKWCDNKSVMLLRSHLEEITSISTV